jgi:ABC-2 type transport system permease protein
MRTIFILIAKEFRQIFRNRVMLGILFLLPVIQLLVLSNAADMEIKHVSLAVQDADNSTATLRLTRIFQADPFFSVIEVGQDADYADHLLRKNRVDAVVAIPAGYGNALSRQLPGDLQVRINAVDGAAAGLVLQYINQVVQSQTTTHTVTSSLVHPVQSRYLYNLQLNYKNYMVPAILVVLVTVIGLMMNALNIAREKEIGTIEQINVTPIGKGQFILGKLIPLLLLGMVEFFMGLAIAHFAFAVPVMGSVLSLIPFLIAYLVVMLAIGLIISSHADTQQQAMFVAFFIMMVFIFLSGMFSAVENMPVWGQWLSRSIPISWFMQDVRSILLKGATVGQLLGDLAVLSSFALVTLTVAIASYRKRSG